MKLSYAERPGETANPGLIKENGLTFPREFIKKNC